MLCPGASPPGTCQTIPKHGVRAQRAFQIWFAAVGGLEGLMYRSTQNGAADALPWFVTVTRTSTPAPAAKVVLLGTRLMLVTTRSGAPTGRATTGRKTLNVR